MKQKIYELFSLRKNKNKSYESKLFLCFLLRFK